MHRTLLDGSDYQSITEFILNNSLDVQDLLYISELLIPDSAPRPNPDKHPSSRLQTKGLLRLSPQHYGTTLPKHHSQCVDLKTFLNYICMEKYLHNLYIKV